MDIHNNYRCKLRTLLIGGIMMTFGLSGTAVGGCLEDPSAIGTIGVDATTACENIDQGLTGCRIEGESGSCEFSGPDGTTTVTATKGPNGGVIWTSTGYYALNWVLPGGSTQGGACAYNYLNATASDAVLGSLKTNGSISRISYLEGCSKLEPPEAKLEVIVTVSADGDCDNASKLVETVIDRDPPEGETATFCYEVSNTGTGDAFNVELMADNGGIVDYPLSIGPLLAGETVTDTNDVLFTERGTFTNRVTVTGDSNGTTLSDTDKATVEVGVAAAACPESYQTLVNGLSDTDNNFAASILLQPKNPGLISLCTPTCTEGDGDCVVKSSSRTLCEDDCIWTSDGECKASGVWDMENAELIAGADRMPYCHEVVNSITDDIGAPLQFTASQTIEILELSVNPYVYQTCYKSGGRKVCETICYLYPGETDAVCPAGSTVR